MKNWTLLGVLVVTVLLLCLTAAVTGEDSTETTSPIPRPTLTPAGSEVQVFLPAVHKGETTPAPRPTLEGREEDHE